MRVKLTFLFGLICLSAIGQNRDLLIGISLLPGRAGYPALVDKNYMNRVSGGIEITKNLSSHFSLGGGMTLMNRGVHSKWSDSGTEHERINTFNFLTFLLKFTITKDWIYLNISPTFSYLLSAKEVYDGEISINPSVLPMDSSVTGIFISSGIEFKLSDKIFINTGVFFDQTFKYTMRNFGAELKVRYLLNQKSTEPRETTGENDD
ncbi:hypothetical protein JYU23_01690 [bacterium AH-315-C07]|nr:hypothetical protein [bacterium AH-315-C07]